MQDISYTPRINDIGPVSTTEPTAPPEAIYGRIMGAFSKFAKAMLALQATPKPEAPAAFTSAADFAAWHSAQWEHKDAETALRTAEKWLVEQIPADLVDVEFIYSADTAFRLGKDKRIHIRNTTLIA